MNSPHDPDDHFSEQWRHGEGMVKQHGAGTLLWQQSDDTSDRRGSMRLHVQVPLDGWLHLDGQNQEPIPVDLVDFSADGVGIVMRAPHAVQAGQLGELVIQTPNSGCSYRSVRCCWRRPHSSHWLLQSAGLCFIPFSGHRLASLTAS